MFSNGLEALLIAQVCDQQDVSHDGTLLCMCTKDEHAEYIAECDAKDSLYKGREYSNTDGSTTTLVYVDNSNQLIAAKVMNSGRAFHFTINDNGRHFARGDNHF